MTRVVIRYVTLLWMCCLLVSSGGYAQLPDFNVQFLDERDGIRTSNILKMVKDNHGFLWMLSPRYVQRFDGQNVKRFDVQGEDLLDIAADFQGNIWVSSQSGIKRYENDYKGFQEIRITGPLPVKLNVLQVTPDNQVWVISGKGLFRYDPPTDSFLHHPIPGMEQQLFYRRIFHRYGVEFFIGDTHQLFAYNTQTQTTRSIRFESVYAITPFSEDILWVTNARLQVFEVNFKTGTVVPIPMNRFYPKLASGFLRINAIVPFGKDNYLVNTSQGCFKYNRPAHTFTKATLYHYGSELANNEIFTSYFDKDGILWILGPQGIIFFRPGQHTIGWLRGYNKEGNDWNNTIKALAGDDAGNLWMATSTGLSGLNLKTGKIKSYHPESTPASVFQFPAIQGLVFDGTNLLLGPGAGGPLLFNPQTAAFKKPVYPHGEEGETLKKQVEQDYIYSIVTLASGDHLVLADTGCYLIEKDSYQLRQVTFTGADYILQTAAQDPSGHLWIGTFKGLLYLDAQLNTVYSDSSFSPNRFITALLPLNDTVTWAGSVGIFEVTKTAGGLLKKPILPELSKQQITMLYRDKAGKVWIGADNGLYRYTGNEDKLEWFDIWDNVQNRQLNPGSLYKASDGMLYLGGNNGLNYFNPQKIESRRQDLNVLITAVTINQDDSLYLMHKAELQKPLPVGKDGPGANDNDRFLELDWNQNSVEIEFVTAYFQNTQKLRYRYRMDGLDTGWVYNGTSNKVRFSSLLPGSYTFSVAASFDGISWHPGQHPFSFKISPPLWKRPWFIAFVLLTIISAGYYLFRRRIEAIRRQQANVYALQSRASSLEKEKALAMYESLKQQLNPHFLFNSLTSLDSLIFIDPKLASNFLEGLSRTYRYILKNRDNELVPLSEEISFAREYIALQKTRFQDGLLVNIAIDDEYIQLKIAPVTLQNLIENAIKHNILAEDNPLVIDIFTTGRQLVIRNKLNRKKFVETSNRQGLANMESLYQYLSSRKLEIIEEPETFTVIVPLV